MSEIESNNNNPNQGYPVHFSHILIVAIAVATLIFGWKVLIAAIGLIVLICLFSLSQIALTRFRESGYQAKDPSKAGYEPTQMSDYCDAQGYCIKCKNKIFSVEIGVTTAEEIRRFAETAEGWRDNPEAREGWMPPGIYCPNGCIAIHIQPITDFTNIDTHNLHLGEKLSKFQDLLATAYKVRKEKDVYKMQESLVAYYRRGKRLFLASMPLRHLYTCDLCGLKEGEVELHYEDASVPSNVMAPAMKWWGSEVGGSLL